MGTTFLFNRKTCMVPSGLNCNDFADPLTRPRAPPPVGQSNSLSFFFLSLEDFDIEEICVGILLCYSKDNKRKSCTCQFSRVVIMMIP